MPKIPNWERADSHLRTNTMIWKNKPDNGNVLDELANESSVIVKERPIAGWKVKIVSDSIDNAQGVGFKEFPTKEKARKYAINWMRNHPEG